MDQLNLSQLKQCNQVWNDMKPTEKGRLCSQCNKNIYDLRKKGNKEINLLHINSPESVCGLYTPSQLNPTAKTTYTGKTYTFYAWLTSAFLLLTNSEIQAKSPKIHTHWAEPKMDSKISKQQYSRAIPDIQKEHIIKGKVLDHNGSPIVYANVLVKNTQVGSATDLKGEFSLDVSEFAETTDSITIVVQYVGYGRTEKTVALPFIEPVIIELNMQESMVAFGVVIREPWYKRWWKKLWGK